MKAVEELEQAVRELSPEHLAEFRQWFAEFDASVWDSQFDADVTAGRLDSLAEQALAGSRQGRSKLL